MAVGPTVGATDDVGALSVAVGTDGDAEAGLVWLGSGEGVSVVVPEHPMTAHAPRAAASDLIFILPATRFARSS